MFIILSAIKTGRYTHEKKTRDIREVKQLQNREAVVQNGRPNIYTPIRRVMDYVEHNDKLETIIKHITAVHLQQTPHTTEFFEKLPKKENDFLVSEN